MVPEPPTKVAVPPSLRVSVGEPPVVLTVTASLMLTVSVTPWPVPRLPLPLVIPVPEVAIELTLGSDRIDLQRAGRIVVGGARQVGDVAGCVLDGRAIEIEGGYDQVRRVLPGRDRVAESESGGARAPDKGRSAAIVERERRRAAGGVDGHRRTEIDRQRDGLAGVQVAAAAW